MVGTRQARGSASFQRSVCCIGELGGVRGCDDWIQRRERDPVGETPFSTVLWYVNFDLDLVCSGPSGRMPKCVLFRTPSEA